MDNGLVLEGAKFVHPNGFVLILIVVDNGLVLLIISLITLEIISLNPYCSGRWSRT